MKKIVFPEHQNEIIKAAIAEAKAEFPNTFEPVFADSLASACEKVRDGLADAMIAGIDYTSREVILACRDIIGVRQTGKTMLYDIILQTHETAEAILAEQPRVAVLSFSTLGSGGSDDSIDRARKVISRIQSENSDIAIDGELQLDAAVNPSIGNKKAPGSTVAGRANVLIAPDLNSGNILYKAMEQFGGFTAAGPILQGFNAPVSDLSRGSTKEDVLAVIKAELALI